MTDTLTWEAIRNDTIPRFQGQTPRPEDEATIIDIFEAQPQLVLRSIDQIAQALTDGKITWAWSALRARLQRGTTPTRDATADTTTERTKRITNAKTWIDNAGIYYDRRDHVEAELFGDDYSRGRLDAYKDDLELRTELLDYWQEQRPRGERAEQDHEDWNAKCKADREVMLTIKAKQQAEAKARYQLPKPPRLTDEEYFEGKPVTATTSPDINFDT